MQKVYLLLRSNKQTGPYSLEELLQLNLKPFDLVWVDGRSAAWQYPFEIPSLKPYVPETPHADAPFKPVATSAMEEVPGLSTNSNTSAEPQNPIPQKPQAPKRVFVSVPKTYAAAAAAEQKTIAQQNSVEHLGYRSPGVESAYERKQEPKEIISSHAPSFAKQQPEDEVHTNYTRSLNEVEEEYTNWMYRRKTKKKPAVNAKDLALAALILAVIGSGYYIMSKPSVGSSVLQKATEPTEPTVQQSKESNIVEQQNYENTAAPVESTVPGAVANYSKPLQKDKKKNRVPLLKSQSVASVPSSKNPMPLEKTTPNIPASKDAVATNEPEVKQQPKTENTSSPKKKKLGEVLKSIFAKKDKAEEPKTNDVVLQTPKSADNRQAQRRGSDEPTAGEQSTEKPSETSTSALAGQVDIYANNNDNWMMGVKNLKVTLRNRSNATIQTAAVTVNYYNENNELLEKKLVYFSNVAPRTKATVAAPDSKYADHVDFKLASVSAKDDRYASY